jgi:meiotic recombination protein SPO11
MLISSQGKGYPDNVSKAWARYLSLGRYPCGSNPMVFGLMDFDPDGLAILSTYKHGSVSAAWQNACLVSPEMKWLGIKSEVIQSLHQDKDDGWLRLTARDRKMATGLLEKAVFQEEVESAWRRQLQVMLMLNIKTEIQVLGDCSSLESFLEKELSFHGVCFTSTDV